MLKMTNSWQIIVSSKRPMFQKIFWTFPKITVFSRESHAAVRREAVESISRCGRQNKCTCPWHFYYFAPRIRCLLNRSVSWHLPAPYLRSHFIKIVTRRAGQRRAVTRIAFLKLEIAARHNPVYNWIVFVGALVLALALYSPHLTTIVNRYLSLSLTRIKSIPIYFPPSTRSDSQQAVPVNLTVICGIKMRPGQRRNVYRICSKTDARWNGFSIRQLYCKNYTTGYIRRDLCNEIQRRHNCIDYLRKQIRGKKNQSFGNVNLSF